VAFFFSFTVIYLIIWLWWDVMLVSNTVLG
jgi:hypothetical protein